MEMNTERAVVIIPSGKSMYRICQGGRTLGFASSFEWAKTRRAMIREGVLDVPALVPALKLAS